MKEITIPAGIVIPAPSKKQQRQKLDLMHTAVYRLTCVLVDSIGLLSECRFAQEKTADLTRSRSYRRFVTSSCDLLDSMFKTWCVIGALRGFGVRFTEYHKATLDHIGSILYAIWLTMDEQPLRQVVQSALADPKQQKQIESTRGMPIRPWWHNDADARAAAKT